MLPSDFDLAGKVALVTGGGSGIGRATALLLAERGANVAVAGRRLERLEACVVEIERSGARALAVTADVRDPDSAAAMVATVAGTLGGIDILVNNAGGAHAHVGLAKLAPAKWQRDLDLNLSSAMYCAQAALPHLRRTRGNVINISSVAGLEGTKGVAAYSAAKAGLQMLTRVAAAEWGPLVRVNCVAPGMTATEAAREAWDRTGFDAEGISRAFPMGRYAECREIAQVIAFLASNAASYVTGETIAVGGGPQIGGMVELEG